MSELAFRSKASWGYDSAFMEKVAPAFLVDADYIAQYPVYVLEADGRLAGFYGFKILEGEPFLHDLWLEPRLIGAGLGRMLWEHLLGTARAQHYPRFLIESDPNAEPFYLHMGAIRIGDRISPETGRRLPLLRYEIAARSPLGHA